ncbi:MAG: hypothetical protein DRI89_15745 [Bacteroidetes bacterium]|nr:MAG: hypothetical protein DRI89_15745 [Bacteroidota bacterium]
MVGRRRSKPTKYKMEDLKKLLLRSYDDELSPVEKEALEKGLLESPELRDEKAAIESIRKTLGNFSPEFEAGFSDRLMQKLETNESKTALPIYTVFKRVALSGAAAIIAMLISIYYTDGSLSLDALYGLYEYAPDEAAVSFFNL